MSGIREVRVGVIGVGAVSQIAHLPALAARDDVTIVGICDADRGKAAALARRFEAHDVFDDIEDLLHRTEPDAVVIATPNHLHEIHVATALSAGAAVLCERPLALTVAGIERVIAAQDRAGRPVVVGMNHRYRADVQAVRAFVHGQELGRLWGARSGWYQFRPSRAELGWRLRGAESGGGAMLDLGLPLLDLGLWLAEGAEPAQVTAVLHRAEGASVEDAGCVLVTCRDGYTIFVDVAWRYIGKQERVWFELTGDKGSARAVPLAVFKEMHGAPVDVTPSGSAARENLIAASYRAEWATFLAVARNEVQAPSLDGQVALHRTMDAVYRSAREGRAVSV
jgi:predicted dehydrogenase